MTTLSEQRRREAFLENRAAIASCASIVVMKPGAIEAPMDAVNTGCDVQATLLLRLQGKSLETWTAILPFPDVSQRAVFLNKYGQALLAHELCLSWSHKWSELFELSATARMQVNSGIGLDPFSERSTVRPKLKQFNASTYSMTYIQNRCLVESLGIRDGRNSITTVWESNMSVGQPEVLNRRSIARGDSRDAMRRLLMGEFTDPYEYEIREDEKWITRAE